ncbi:hypothetical protein O4J55_14300 [Paracoccus sp. PXZ]
MERLYVVSFSTDTPLEHLSRALDELRRIGCRLAHLSVGPGSRIDRPCGSTVRMAFHPAGSLSGPTVLNRIARMPDIRAFRGGPARP